MESDTFAADPEFSQDILDQPNVLGPVASGDWAMTVRVSLKVKPERRLEFSRELQKHLLKALKEEGISRPYPRQDSVVLSG
ncbi:MAG: hypothetical protein ACK2TW_04080 [Anaerolineales bacterium]